MSHESSRPVPMIKILEDKILPALERVDLRQFFWDTGHALCSKKKKINKFRG